MSTYTGSIDWYWQRKGGRWLAHAYGDYDFISPKLDDIIQGDVVSVEKADGTLTDHVVFRIEYAQRYGNKMSVGLMLYSSEDPTNALAKAQEYLDKSRRARKDATVVKHLENARKALMLAKSAVERDTHLGIRISRAVKSEIAAFDDELSMLI